MARKLSSREIGLLVALLAAGLAWFWYSNRSSQATAAAEAAAAAKAGAPVEKPPQVMLDLLLAHAERYNPEGRDLFKYAVRPPTAAELRAAREAELARQRALEEEAKRRAEEFARNQDQQRRVQEELVKNPPKPQPPPIPLKYLGVLGPKNDRVAAFEDESGEVFVHKKGEIVKGQFRLIDIKLESVVMGYTRPEFKDDTREIALTAQNK